VEYSQNWGSSLAWLLPGMGPSFPDLPALGSHPTAGKSHGPPLAWNPVLCNGPQGGHSRGFAMDIVRLIWWYLVCITKYLLP
jgi:hypothetical protein